MGDGNAIRSYLANGTMQTYTQAYKSNPFLQGTPYKDGLKRGEKVPQLLHVRCYNAGADLSQLT